MMRAIWGMYEDMRASNSVLVCVVRSGWEEEDDREESTYESIAISVGELRRCPSQRPMMD